LGHSLSKDKARAFRIKINFIIMTREEIIKQINAEMAEEFEVSEDLMTPEANIKDTLNLDSLNLVDIVAMVQQYFGIDIPIADLRNIKTFNDLYDYIEKHQK
jgi:acyl carrier protein